MKVKKCPECGFAIIGRADKVFCSDGCRTKNNNRRQKDQNGFIREINKSLRKNREILHLLVSKGKFETSRIELLEKGFDFNHFTSLEVTGDKQIIYCYDMGYRIKNKAGIELYFKK